MESEWIISRLRHVLNNLGVFSDGRHVSTDICDASLLNLDLVHREFVIAESLEGLSGSEQAALNFIIDALAILRNIQDEDTDDQQYPPPIMYTGMVGRPRFTIPRDQLLYLIENNFTAPQMAQMIGVSLRTIHRRMSEYGLSISAQYAVLTDSELDQLVVDIQDQFPLCGNRQMHGHLLSQGHRVQQRRIRESQRRTCPEGTMMRRLGCLRRRKYKVAAPRSLYHIDGNHKLVRYIELVIAGNGVSVKCYYKL